MNKKRNIVLIFFFFIAAIVIAVIYGTEKEKLPVGSYLPGIYYSTEHSSRLLKPDGRPLVIMFFKPGCPHCEYELSTMNNRVDELRSGDFYFLTTDKDYIKNKTYEKWNNLNRDKYFVFALINDDDFKSIIGINAAPLFLIYNKHGILIDKVLGETKFDRILGSIINAGGAQHQ